MQGLNFFGARTRECVGAGTDTGSPAATHVPSFLDLEVQGMGCSVLSVGTFRCRDAHRIARFDARAVVAVDQESNVSCRDS